MASYGVDVMGAAVPSVGAEVTAVLSVAIGDLVGGAAVGVSDGMGVRVIVGVSVAR